MTLGEIVNQLDVIDPVLTIYAHVPPASWSLDMDTTLLEQDVDDESWQPPAGLFYFLEVEVARDVRDGWTHLRGTTAIDADETARTILYYATNDAWPRLDRAE